MLQKIPVGKLEPGMVLGKDILGKDALIMLSRGKSLDDKNITYLLEKFGAEKEILIYIAEDQTLPEIPGETALLSEPQKTELPYQHSADIPLEIFQKLIQENFAHREDYQITRALVASIQKDIHDAFDYLMSHNEINEAKFLKMAHKVIRYFELEKQLINPAYFYLFELEKWHPDTLNHSIDVAFYALFIASHFSSDSGELNSIFLGGLLHDIGKYTHFKEGDHRFYEIITKNGPLTEREFDILKNHVDVNSFFENKFSFMTAKERDNIRFAALDHHEKLDGSGYLRQKRGMQISLAGRIVAIADIYDAMIRKREYKSMVRPDIAMKHVTSLANTGKLDKQYAFIFRKLLGIYPTGSVISTSRGFAVVIGQTENPERPKVMLVEHHDLGEISLVKYPEIEIYEEIE